MKTNTFTVIRYDADDGMVFDWAEARFEENEEGNQIQQHLYAKTLFIGGTDTIENYVEVAQPVD